MNATLSPAGDERRLTRMCALLLALVALWNCREVLSFEFVARDDDINIYFNPHLGPPSAQSLSWMFTDVSYMRRYLPLGWLSFSLVYQFSGLSPIGYHTANLALHVANTLLVFALLLKLARSFARHDDSRSLVLAAAAGAGFWSLHPFRAETIGWCSGLLYGTAGFWALTSTLFYLHAHTAARIGPQRIALLIAATAAYTFSVLTYPIGIALPLVFIAIDFSLPDANLQMPRPMMRRLMLEKIAFLVPGAVIAVMTVLGRLQVSAMWPPAPSWEEFPLLQRISQAFAVWAYYVWKSAWPFGLTMAPTWLFDVTPWRPLFVGSGIFVLGLTALLITRRSRRNALMLWLAYLALVAPMAGFTEHPHFAGDRYSYLAGVTLSAVLVFAMLRTSPRLARAAMLAIVCTLILGFSALQRRQLHIWESTDTLFARTIAESRNVDFSADNYRKWAMLDAYEGQIDKARKILLEAQRFVPTHPHVLALERELADYATRGRMAKNGRVRPAASELHEKLAVDFSRMGRVVETHEHFQAAHRLAPEIGGLTFNWAVYCALTHDPFRGLHLYHQATAETIAEPPAVPARVRLLLLLTDSFAVIERPELAARSAKAAVRLAQTSGDSQLIAAADGAYRRASALVAQAAAKH